MYGKPAWDCICECGNKITVYGESLKHGKTKSCGCLQREKVTEAGKLNKKQNEYYVYENIVFVKTFNTGNLFICDLDDWNNLIDYCWSESPQGYIAARRKDRSGLIRFNRAVMNPPKDKFVDHINGYTLDNRKSNLRIVTNSENCKNRKLSKNNKTGASGIYYRKKRGIWEACIGVDYNKVYIGSFSTKEEAIKAREQAEIKYYGEFRRVV